MKTTRFFYIFSAILFLMTFSTPVLSQDAVPVTVSEEDDALDEKGGLYKGFDIPMPDIPYFNKEQIIEHMQYFEDMAPSDDKYSGYRIFIPKGWEKAPEEIIRNTASAEGYILGEIAKYDSDPDDLGKSTVRIEAIDLEHNISAKNWLLKYLLDYGYVLEGLSEKNWSRAEALGVIYKNKEVDYKDRMVAQINGKRIILVTYSSPVYLWEQEKSYQATVAKSFNITEVATSYQEEMLSFDITGYVEFKYPSNWKLGILNQKDYDRPSIRLINLDEYDRRAEEHGHDKKEQYSKGIISVQTIIFEGTGTTLAYEVDAQKDVVQKLGIELGEKIKSDMKIVFPTMVESTKLDIFYGNNVKEDNPNYEVWVAYMKNDEAYYIVTMVTPNKGSRYFAWVENKSAFEAIVSSLEPISFYDE